MALVTAAAMAAATVAMASELASAMASVKAEGTTAGMAAATATAMVAERGSEGQRGAGQAVIFTLMCDFEGCCCFTVVLCQGTV
jgi:hypothetical protein